MHLSSLLVGFFLSIDVLLDRLYLTHITLTDEEDIPDAIGKLRTVYHRLMKLDYDNRRTRSSVEISGATDVESKSPLELFSDFYELQNNQPMNPEQFEYMKSLIEKTWEGEQ